jgi:hypothetical protein
VRILRALLLPADGTARVVPLGHVSGGWALRWYWREGPAAVIDMYPGDGIERSVVGWN